MKQGQELIEALNRAVNVPQMTVLGEVISVDMTKQTAEMKLDEKGNVTYTVRLKSIVDSEKTGFIVFPAVGAKVLATKIYNKDDYVMLTCSEAQEVWLRGKANGDLINISDIVGRLNSIEDKVNSIISTFNTHAHTGVTTGGGTSGTTATTVSGSLENTTESDINDEKVKH